MLRISILISLRIQLLIVFQLFVQQSLLRCVLHEASKQLRCRYSHNSELN